MIQLSSSHKLPAVYYLYQRNGVYYFRLRVRQSNNDRMTSVSLRTKDRRTAMAHSRHIKAALKAIHADRPNATYEEMR
ncbi:integrase, partial [Shigella sonnei]|nr:integrase [Shigella sonnei]EGD4666270.1 integrase [Shigella flexneri]